MKNILFVFLFSFNAFAGVSECRIVAGDFNKKYRENVEFGTDSTKKSLVTNGKEGYRMPPRMYVEWKNVIRTCMQSGVSNYFYKKFKNKKTNSESCQVRDINTLTMICGSISYGDGAPKPNYIPIEPID